MRWVILTLLLIAGCTQGERTAKSENQHQDVQETLQESQPAAQEIEPVELKLDKTKYEELINRHCADFLQLEIHAGKSIQMQKLEKEIMKMGANNCYDDIATVTNEEKLCKLTEAFSASQLHHTTTEAYEYCLKSTGAYNLRPELCEQITTEEIRKLCFADLEFYKEEKANASQ